MAFCIPQASAEHATDVDAEVEIVMAATNNAKHSEQNTAW